jgi:hypothetical protein
LGCNTFVHGSNARNLCIAVLISTRKCFVFLIISFVFFSTKLEIDGHWEDREQVGDRGTMTQTIYAEVNK